MYPENIILGSKSARVNRMSSNPSNIHQRRLSREYHYSQNPPPPKASSSAPNPFSNFRPNISEANTAFRNNEGEQGVLFENIIASVASILAQINSETSHAAPPFIFRSDTSSDSHNERLYDSDDTSSDTLNESFYEFSYTSSEDSDDSLFASDNLSMEENTSTDSSTPPTNPETPAQTNKSDRATTPPPRPKKGPIQKLKALIRKVIHFVGRKFKKEKAAGVSTNAPDFIVQSILKNVEPQTIELVKEGDPEIFSFILTKAIYVLTLGDGKDQQVPLSFHFKDETIQEISSLRGEIHSRKERKNLHLNDPIAMRNLYEVTNDLPAFQDGSSNINSQLLFNRIRGIASEELQGGRFITNHFAEAVLLIPNDPETVEST